MMDLNGKPYEILDSNEENYESLSEYLEKHSKKSDEFLDLELWFEKKEGMNTIHSISIHSSKLGIGPSREIGSTKIYVESYVGCREIENDPMTDAKKVLAFIVNYLDGKGIRHGEPVAVYPESESPMRFLAPGELMYPIDLKAICGTINFDEETKIMKVIAQKHN